MTWTRFMDMHSGGEQKEDFSYCYIEAPEEEAISIFYSRFGHNPERVTCSCCGEDYSISERETLEDATKFERTGWGSRRKNVSLEDYVNQDDVLVIYADDIDAAEFGRKVPRQGYIWVDDYDF